MWTTAVKHLPVTTIGFNIHNSIIFFYNLKNLYQHFKCYWQLQFRKIRYSHADDSITLVCLIIVCSRISLPSSVQTVINVLLCSRTSRIQRVRFWFSPHYIAIIWKVPKLNLFLILFDIEKSFVWGSISICRPSITTYKLRFWAKM